MKILKIELQNINSLKSDSPIVINFENDQFKDVGLYAITGSTGAGKTTILDAITIALYHSVPRFNNSKGSLFDVVSHGANDAFTRITFENEKVIYEAYWGIRLASKTGKRLNSPQETVSLKNLTADTILASQKRAVIEEVIKVTQLDYVQFLRSVMLAQGEFASFLTAKGPEKGRLLEQITGEQVYKKIGQGILDKKSQVESKLKEIQSKINSADVLTEEGKVELRIKDKELDVEINNIEKKIISVRSIMDWYVSSQKNIDEATKLDLEDNEIKILIEKHKEELTLLDLNEKAEPFKELIQNFNRNEKNSSENANQLKTLKGLLTLLQPEIERLTEFSKKQSIELENANKEFTDWLPKFDSITNIDAKLKHQSANKQTTQQQFDAVIQQIEALTTEEKGFTKNLVDTRSKIEIEEVFIHQHNFLKEVDSEISTWTSELTTLKATKETLHQETVFIIEKKKEVEKTTTDLEENQKLLDKKTAEIENIEKEFSDVTKQLAKDNIPDLRAQQAKLSIVEANWKQFKTLSEQTIKIEKDRTNLRTQEKSSSTELAAARKQIEAFKQQIEIQEKLVTKAEEVLNLEKRISKYEDDRQHLINGEPCGLCGSKEHPFADHSVQYNVSDAEIALEKTKTELAELNTSKSNVDKREVQLITTINGLTQQINSLTEEIVAFNRSASRLNIECEVTNSAKIDIELNLSTAQIKSLDTQLTAAQQLQTKKSDLSDQLNAQNESVTALKTGVATLTANRTNATTEIDAKEISVEKLRKAYTELESALTTKLAVFNYPLPALDEKDAFIQTIEKSITDFAKRQKELTALKANIELVNTQVSNNKKQVETHTKTQDEYRKTIGECKTTSEALTVKRIAILPLDVSVESKRTSLQFAKNQLTEKVEISKQHLQKQLDVKTEKEALLLKTNKDQKELVQEIYTLQSTLDLQIKNTDFESKQAIKNALLTNEDKVSYTKNKEFIKERQLKLEALKGENLKAKETLLQAKNFETSREENQVVLEELNVKNKGLLTQRGEIVEAFRKNQEIRDRNKEIYLKIDAQEAICTIWRELFKIIGNSKDAFNVYVQRLTLKHLLNLANVHLYKLNKRYTLKMEEGYKPKEELNFNLIDHYQTDQARLVDTSSGGEKFIISLALALGLSDLASKSVKIDSLFIDEGFGTLDGNTLETVISTLETLQSQGKMIGIISHVENLKERIPTQIQVTKKSNGVSVVEIL